MTDRPGTTLSGWCLPGMSPAEHAVCRYAPCTCGCHHGEVFVATFPDGTAYERDRDALWTDSGRTPPLGRAGDT